MTVSVDDPEVRAAGEFATRLAQQVSPGNLDACKDALLAAYAAFVEHGGRPAEIIPGDAAGLGFKPRGQPDRERLWDVYTRLIRIELCSPKGELYKKVKSGLSVTGASMVTAVLTTFGLAAIAAAVIAPIVAVILSLGLKAFCEFTEPASKK